MAMNIPALVPLLFAILAAPALGQTTRPATRPAVVSVRLDELNALKAEVERLRDDVEKLRRENESLKAARSPAAVVDAKIAAAIKDGRLTVGMTLAEADAAMKRHNPAFIENRLVREAGDAQLYEFIFEGQVSGSRFTPGKTQWAWIRNGKIVEWGK